MIGDIEQGPEFIPTKPRPLLEERVSVRPQDRAGPVFDLAPDGKSIVFIGREQGPRPVTDINVVLDWFEELKERVPTGQ